MKSNSIYILIIGLIGLSSFAVLTQDKEALIEEALKKRLKDYELELLRNCREDAIEEAEMTVDSIISIELGAGPIDTINFPRKPLKPSFEPYDSLENSPIELKPLFDKNEIDPDTIK